MPMVADAIGRLPKRLAFLSDKSFGFANSLSAKAKAFWIESRGHLSRAKLMEKSRRN
jgi:hypothetical protein